MPYPVSAVRNKGGVVVTPPAPAKPTGLSATPVSTSQIDLAWTDVATTETAYKVYRSTDGVNYAQVGTDLAAGTQAYSDTTPTSGTTYYYKVAAVNAGGETLSDADSTNTLMYGLVIALNMNETSGNRADDTGRGNTAVLTGTVGSDTGILGNAAKSAAWNNNYLKVLYGTDLALGDVDWEIAVWIYPTDVTAYPSIMGQGGVADDWLVWFDKDVGKFRFTAGVQTALSSVVISANNWYSIHVWHDSGNDKIGISVNNNAAGLTTKTGGIADTSGDLYIGRRATVSDAAWNNSRLDRVYKWTRLLTSTERTADYNGGAPFALPF